MFEIVFGGIFSLAGLAALLLSICLFRSAFRKRKTWKSTTGIVVGYGEYVREVYKTAPSIISQRTLRRDVLAGGAKSVRDHGNHLYRPQVQFTTESGEQVVITSNVGSTTQRNRIGDHVKVLYDTNDPDKGVIKSFSNLYMAPFIIGFMAICFIGLGGHMIYTIVSPKM